MKGIYEYMLNALNLAHKWEILLVKEEWVFSAKGILSLGIFEFLHQFILTVLACAIKQHV